jgi:hypothetical protein
MISSSLIIPYSEVVSSVNTNCKNSPLVFYSAYDKPVWDFNTSLNSQEAFYNIFYIKSFTESAYSIVSRLRDSLMTTLKANPNTTLPVFQSFNMYLSLLTKRNDPTQLDNPRNKWLSYL